MNARTIVITGASRGIGACLARGLAADGHRVALLARDAAALEALAAETGGLAVPIDLLDAAAVAPALAQIEAALGPIEVLINNAGTAMSAPLARTRDADWARTMALNVEAPFRLCRAVAPGMASRKFGRVVFVASVAGLTGAAYTSAYCASKHAVIGLCRSLAAEFARKAVTFNAVCPGFVNTPMTDATVANIAAKTGMSTADARGYLEQLNPQRRLVESEEILHLTRMLIADAAHGLTGQAIALDGGQVMH
jgi:NAD(P)-dependent dehydrogenase (short-subunit alcohol dehydrogenase family)